MKDAETVKRFIDLRAKGWTYVRIATELGVAKSTLIEWSRKFRFDINNQRVLELDELQDRILGPVQFRVNGLAEKLGKVEEELRKRDLSQVPTARLYSMADALQRQIARETQAIRFVSPVKDIPNDEYVAEVQEWTP